MAGEAPPRVAIEPAPASPLAGTAAAPPHDVGLGYLRAATTVAVIAYHALIAYYPGPFPFSPHVMRMAFPVRDAVHFAGAKTLVAFFDSYFMSLMFLISGAFLWPSLTRKGAGAFVRGRALRLGLPFLFSVGMVGALAYYPAYLLAHPDGTVAGYFADWQRPGQWLGGPAWFIAVLLAFDVAAAALYLAWPRWGPTLGRLAQRRRRAPFAVLRAGRGGLDAGLRPAGAVARPVQLVERRPLLAAGEPHAAVCPLLRGRRGAGRLRPAPRPHRVAAAGCNDGGGRGGWRRWRRSWSAATPRAMRSITTTSRACRWARWSRWPGRSRAR